MKQKTVYFWVAASSPYNSILIQIKLLCARLEKLFNIKYQILTPETPNVKHILLDASKTKDTLFWHYGGYDRYLSGINKKNVCFVYHNITPAKFFIRYEPKVAVAAVLGYLQMKLLIDKSVDWITMSKFNIEELKAVKFTNVNYCPNIIVQNIPVSEMKTENPSLLFIGRISPNKNILSLIDHVAHFAASQNKRINFTIVGDGKQNCGYYKHFLNKIKINYKNLNVIWLKNLDDYEMANEYQKAWLYVSMSKHEGFGVPACESIVYNTPVLYLQCGGQETVLNFLGAVKNEDENTFYKEISKLITNKVELQNLLLKQKEVVSNIMVPKVDDNIYAVYKKYFNNEI